ncbi:MAG: NADAR family protein [Clostridia bacterium]|nr:NADAR family protein [Clostridia bacterium]
MEEKYGCFSNWYTRVFVVDGQEYRFVEQYMMDEKAKLFHDEERYADILRATHPRECKALGRQVKPFDAKVLGAARYEIVKTASRAKFEQNPELMAKLLETGEAVLAEASPKDMLWGIGLDRAAAADTNPAKWPGRNLLGRILMELRAEFAGKKASSN